MLGGEMITATVYGQRAIFCVEACEDGFRTDRRYGLIYGPFRLPEESGPTSWERGTRIAGECAYCRADLRDYDEEEELS
jgi:hypothetical protein